MTKEQNELRIEELERVLENLIEEFEEPAPGEFHIVALLEQGDGMQYFDARVDATTEDIVAEAIRVLYEEDPDGEEY